MRNFEAPVAVKLAAQFKLLPFKVKYPAVKVNVPVPPVVVIRAMLFPLIKTFPLVTVIAPQFIAVQLSTLKVPVAKESVVPALRLLHLISAIPLATANVVVAAVRVLRLA